MDFTPYLNRMTKANQERARRYLAGVAQAPRTPDDLEQVLESFCTMKGPRTAPAHTSKFTTQYAIDWGRSKGWRLVDRERYDARLKRHHDLECGADAKMETPTDFVLVQGAGVGERAAHRRRFEERGGVERCKKANCRFAYVEFKRGEPEQPTLIERWA
jgi:hypothetical protein